MIVITQWGGLATNASPYSLPPGAAVTQVNVQVLTPGVLSVRPGMAAMSWSSHSGSTAPVIALHRFQNGTTETVVYQNSSGAIFYAKGPA